MANIVLSTFNARFHHCAVGLRFLAANLGEQAGAWKILEFVVTDRVLDVAEKLLAEQPQVIGLGVYIWNRPQTYELVRLLKSLQPELCVVIGGPEVTYASVDDPLVRAADILIRGEADLAFAEVCRTVLAGGRPAPVIAATPPQMAELVLPYDLYTDADIAHRTLYVESSRGCPYTCQFCLSSIEKGVRVLPLPRVFEALNALLSRGVRQFKFLDRTFNLNMARVTAILEFFLERYEEGMFLHFEMVPERLPDSLLTLLARFPAHTVQLEVGIQTFDPQVATRIQRSQDNSSIEANLRALAQKAQVHLHADLIAGLPGEGLTSFGAGFDRLEALGVAEIQVGILKLLQGAPIIIHLEAFEMVFAPEPPYEVLRTKDLSFTELQRLRRFARYWDLVGNSGNFRQSAPLLWGDSSPFDGFMAFSDWLFAETGATHNIALMRLSELVFRYLIEVRVLAPQDAAERVLTDYQRSGRNDVPPFLRPHLPNLVAKTRQAPATLPRRQARHAQALAAEPVDESPSGAK